jgi:hypothetical protein
MGSLWCDFNLFFFGNNMKKLVALILMLFSISVSADMFDTTQRSCSCAYDPNIGACSISNAPKRAIDFVNENHIPYSLDGKDLKLSGESFVKFCSGNPRATPQRYVWNFADGKAYLSMTW